LGGTQAAAQPPTTENKTAHTILFATIARLLSIS
jgi:hypothetical protein